MLFGRLPLFIFVFPMLVSAVGCTASDSNIRDQAQCDGELNSVEESVDDAFDADGDGYFDIDNADCQGVYELEQLDCDDGNPDVHPGMLEVTCNDVDDDCSEETLDSPDSDADGAYLCDGDCDDANPDVHPGLDEVACDQLDNDCDAETLDGEDSDGDGYTTCEDCDDDNDAVNPEVAEAQCNGLDDDCNELTADGDDVDADGINHCFDCDDSDPLRYPGNEEICDDGVDQNCDTVDEPCVADWSGVWDTTPVSYSCADIGTGPTVNINFSQLSVVHDSATISFTSVASSQPGTMSGTLTGDSFSASLVVPGSCTEEYTLTGSFTGPDVMTATFSASFVDALGFGLCLDCVGGSWSVDGTLP
ncbi:MAG: hypothetical protein CL928_19520 [Deltaproteobacteria bacterium]|nr:hypothetical protein [Deltaproteobacteria bacterium]